MRYIITREIFIIRESNSKESYKREIKIYHTTRATELTTLIIPLHQHQGRDSHTEIVKLKFWHCNQLQIQLLLRYSFAESVDVCISHTKYLNRNNRKEKRCNTGNW